MAAFAVTKTASSSSKNRQIIVVELKKLKGHEQINPEYLEILKNQIKSNGILKKPIAVDENTYVVLDGHHRLEALKKLGYKKIPVKFVDYNSLNIIVLAWRIGERVTKDVVINAGLNGKKLLPKTSKHMINLNGKLKHISAIENRVDIPLERLK